MELALVKIYFVNKRDFLNIEIEYGIEIEIIKQI